MASAEKLIEMANDHLDNDESILYCVFGTYKDKRGWVRKGIFIASEKRVIFYGKRSFGRYDIESFPYERINSMEMGKSFVGLYINLFTSNNSVSINWIQKEEETEVEHLVAYVRNRTTGTSSNIALTKQSSGSVADELRKFTELWEQGIISEEEYVKVKNSLLGKTKGDQHSVINRRRHEREQKEAEKTANTKRTAKNGCFGCLGCLGFLFILGLLMNACGMIPDDSDDAYPPSKHIIYHDDQTV